MKKHRLHPEYQYLDLLQEVLKNGVRKEDLLTGDASYSVFGKQIRFDLSQGFPLLTTKKTYWKGIVHELYWFMSGQSNIKYLIDNNVHIWDYYPYKVYKKMAEGRKVPKMTQDEFIQKIRDGSKFARKYGNLPKIYGELWRHWPTRTKGRTIDQLRWLVNELRKDPNAHNALVTSWNPEYLYTMALKKDACRFPICHNMYQVNIIGNKLSLQLYQRSADLFLGVPFNIASYALLTIILAQVLGYEPGEFVHTFGDAHIYENHLEQVKEQLKRKPFPFPTVRLDPSIKDIDDFTADKVTLENYESHPMIKAELALVGGLVEKPSTKKKAKR